MPPASNLASYPELEATRKCVPLARRMEKGSKASYTIRPPTLNEGIILFSCVSLFCLLLLLLPARAIIIKYLPNGAARHICRVVSRLSP